MHVIFIIYNISISIIINIKPLQILELAVGFESKKKSDRKLNNYRPLVLSLSSSYHEVKFGHVSMSALGVLDNSCDSSIELLQSLNFPEKLQRCLISKIMNIVIYSTFCILCRSTKIELIKI